MWETTSRAIPKWGGKEAPWAKSLTEVCSIFLAELTFAVGTNSLNKLSPHWFGVFMALIVFPPFNCDFMIFHSLLIYSLSGNSLNFVFRMLSVSSIPKYL